MKNLNRVVLAGFLALYVGIGIAALRSSEPSASNQDARKSSRTIVIPTDARLAERDEELSSENKTGNNGTAHDIRRVETLAGVT
jgi:hypothetical protein